MKRDEGKKVAASMMAKGFSLKGWARANDICYRTLQEFLYNELGHIRGGAATDKIVALLQRDGFLGEDKQVVNGH